MASAGCVLDALLPLPASGHIPLAIFLHPPTMVKVFVACGVMVLDTLFPWQPQPRALGIVSPLRWFSLILRCGTDHIPTVTSLRVKPK